MSHRNTVEGVNGNLKRNFANVDRGYARVFGTERVAFLLAFTLAGLNVLPAKSFRRMLKAVEERASAPRTRAKRRTRTFDEVLGTTRGLPQSRRRARPRAAVTGTPPQH